MDDQASIIDLIDRLCRVAGNDRNAQGLNPVQWEALRYFARANRFSCNPSGLGQYLGVTKGTVSQTIIALTKKGLLRKTPDPGDRRGVHVNLTPAGQRLLEDDPLRQWARDLSVLSRAEQQALRGSLERLLRSALDQRGRQPFGVCRSCTHFRREHELGHPHYCALLKAPLSESDSGMICREQVSA